MSTYKLKAPFMTRVGQFEAGKQTLVVGVLESVILGGDGGQVLHLTIGNSKTKYTQTYAELREAPYTIWTNRQGKRVRIIPVSFFKAKRSPEEEPQRNIQSNLFSK